MRGWRRAPARCSPSRSRSGRAATAAISVDYATSDGTAQAGADYTAASGTLSFQAGESSGTIEVAVLDDAHDEGEETLTLRLSNASGGELTDGEATGTIENTDLMPAALLARFGRATAEQVVDPHRGADGGTAAAGLPGAVRRAGSCRAGAARGTSRSASCRSSRRRWAWGRRARPRWGWAHSAGWAGSAGHPAWAGDGRPGWRDGRRGPDGDGPRWAPSARAFVGRHGRGRGHVGAWPMGGYGPMGGAHGGGLFGSMGMGGDLFSNSEFELNRESRGGILSVWSSSSRSLLQGPGGRAVAQRRRAHDDARGRLFARPADARPVGGTHPRPGRLQRPERRADEHVDDRVLPVGGLPGQRPGVGVGDDRLRHRVAEPDAGRRNRRWRRACR